MISFLGVTWLLLFKIDKLLTSWTMFNENSNVRDYEHRYSIDFNWFQSIWLTAISGGRRNSATELVSLYRFKQKVFCSPDYGWSCECFCQAHTIPGRLMVFELFGTLNFLNGHTSSTPVGISGTWLKNPKVVWKLLESDGVALILKKAQYLLLTPANTFESELLSGMRWLNKMTTQKKNQYLTISQSTCQLSLLKCLRFLALSGAPLKWTPWFRRVL